MAVQKHQRSSSRQGKARAHHHLILKGLTKCQSCNKIKRNHYICWSCSSYNNKDYTAILKKGKLES